MAVRPDLSLDSNGLNSNDTEVGTTTTLSPVTKHKKGWSRFHITIEPIKFSVGFVLSFTGGVIIDMVQRNACFGHYNLSYKECTSPNISTEIKTNVEASTALVHMINNIILGLLSLCLVFFIGPWSDSNGRKPFILWALRGFFIHYLIWGVFSFFPSVPVLWLCVTSFPIGLTGGMMTLYICTWCYLCDNFEPQERVLRFTLSSAALVIGGLIGNSLAEQVVLLGGDYGFPIVFFISSAVVSFAILYSTIILEETIVCDRKKDKLIDMKHVNGVINAVFMKPKKGHVVMTFVMIIIFTEIPDEVGRESVVYLVGKSQYNWSLGTFNLFSALASFISAVGPVVTIGFFNNVIGLNNAAVLVILCGSVLLLTLLRSLAINEEMYWSVSLILKFINCIGCCVDGELVETVSEDNVGKAFTITSLMDALSPVVAIPMFTQLYTYLLPDRTLYVFFLTFALTSITLTGSIGLLASKGTLYYVRASSEPNEQQTTPNATELSPIYS